MAESEDYNELCWRRERDSVASIHVFYQRLPRILNRSIGEIGRKPSCRYKNRYSGFVGFLVSPIGICPGRGPFRKELATVWSNRLGPKYRRTGS